MGGTALGELPAKVSIESRPHKKCGYTQQEVLGVLVDRDHLFMCDRCRRFKNRHLFQKGLI